MPAVFLTVDTEFAWRHHQARRSLDDIYRRSVEPAGVGIGYQLARLARHGLKATFFVDPMPALAFGLEPIRRLVATILDAGQEVQLHCHPNWTAAQAGDGGAHHARFEMLEYGRDEQRALIAGARDLLVAAGAPAPVAFRAGSFGANDDTLAACRELGLIYDSSHNGAERPWPSQIGLGADRIAPLVHEGVVEVPVTVIEERPGRFRGVQVCAISTAEMRAALGHAIVFDHAVLTIVSHSFELATRAGTGINAVHVRRFDALCAMLADVAELTPTVHFADRPALPLDRDDRPLGPNALRTGWRQAEQLWSNVVAERAA